MNNVHISESLKNFLFDLDYFITSYENVLYVFNYQDLELLTDKEIILSIANFKLKIVGSDLTIKKMTKKELKIIGTIMKLEYVYD